MDRVALERRLLELPDAERRKLRAYFRKNLAREDDPEDGIQETFTRAFLHAEELADDAKLMSWLWGIAVLVAVEMKRLTLVRRERFSRKAVEPTGHEPPPSARSEDDERRARVRAALDQLSDELRLPIELNVFAGLSQNEIAEALGWTLAQVKNRAKAGHEKLLALLADVEI